MNRAYSLLEIKAIDEDERVITGVASTPTPDRGGDVLESKGAVFQLPMPFLWQHKQAEPLGEVFAAKVMKDGIEIKARIAKIDEPGRLKERIDEAWQSIKNKLVRGFSIGWKPIEFKPIPGSFGIHASKWLWLETSAVTIPMNAEATITSVKAFDAEHLAASGNGDGAQQVNTPGASGTPVVRLKRARQGPAMKKPIAERIKEFEAERAAKVARMDEIQTKASDEGRNKDEAEREEFTTLSSEIKAIDAELTDLREMETLMKSAAAPVAGANPTLAAHARSATPVITVKATRAPGIGLARAMLCKMAAYLSQGSMSPVEFAKQRYPDDTEVQTFLKATVNAGTTTDTTWASPLVEPTTLANEFVEFLRPMTIIGKFGTNGIPSLRRLPFNIRIPRQTSGGTGYWVGEGKPKPLTSFAFDDVTLAYTKVAAIAVITRELARFSNPSAETIVRDQLARACVERIDIDLIDPAKAVSAGVNPASLTNGLTALSSAGTSADNARTDIQNLLEQYILNDMDVTGLVLIMPSTLALALSIMVNSLGQREFPDLTMRGGTLLGIPVITSQYAANEAQYGNLVIAVDTSNVGLADDGQVDIDVSSEASLQMLDNPTNESGNGTATTMVSMFQTNSLAIRAERFINWTKLRSGAVVYMDDVNWGAIGSPV